MTLQRAIEILTLKVNYRNHHDLLDYNDAAKLGIEALRRVETLRQHGHLHGGRPLPGETKE